MKIALFGYGKMGKTIERIAVSRGHEIVLIVDIDNRNQCTDEQLKKADVVIDFSTPNAAVANYKWCFACGMSVVSGTTGWLEKWDEVIADCQAHNAGFFYASNYSTGVNIFLHLNNYLAKIMSKFPEYQAYIEETHHIHKLDKPSGTAITIAEGVMDNNANYKEWKLDSVPSEGVLPIASLRRGEVPGIHDVTYISSVDEITIHHSAYSRDGLALGAVRAAEFMCGKKGIFGMDDLLKI